MGRQKAEYRMQTSCVSYCASFLSPKGKLNTLIYFFILFCHFTLHYYFTFFASLFFVFAKIWSSLVTSISTAAVKWISIPTHQVFLLFQTGFCQTVLFYRGSLGVKLHSSYAFCNTRTSSFLIHSYLHIRCVLFFAGHAIPIPLRSK